MWYVDVVEYYRATKKGEIMAFAATWTQPESIVLGKSEKDECHVLSLACRI